MKVPRKKRGSSLIEVLIAMAILGLLVAPFLTMFLQAARANAVSREMMDASYYGQNLMEEIKYNIVSGMDDAKSYLTDHGYTEQEYTEQHYDYTKTDGDFTYVVDLDGTDGMENNFFKITVKVFADEDKNECKANIQVLCQ